MKENTVKLLITLANILMPIGVILTVALMIVSIFQQTAPEVDCVNCNPCLLCDVTVLTFIPPIIVTGIAVGLLLLINYYARKNG